MLNYEHFLTVITTSLLTNRPQRVQLEQRRFAQTS